MSTKLEEMQKKVEQAKKEYKSALSGYQTVDRKALQNPKVRELRKKMKRAQRQLRKIQMATGLLPRKKKKSE